MSDDSSEKPLSDSMRMGNKPKWYSPFEWAGVAILEIASHFVVVSVLICGLKLIEMLLESFWRHDKDVFLGTDSLRILIRGADLALLLGVLTFGIFNLISAYTNWKRRNKD